MATAITVTSVTYPPAGGVTVTYSDGSETTYASREELASAVALVGNGDWAKLMLLKAWHARSPDLSDPSWVIGTTLQVDMGLELGQVQTGKVG